MTVTVLTFGAMVVPATTAWATHWPMAGGDAGRSGSQQVDQSALPMKFRWRAPLNVRTSPIVTIGADPAAQRVVFGYFTTDGGGSDVNGRIGVFGFGGGNALTAADIDDEAPRDGVGAGNSDPDQFGPVHDVAPMEASGHSGAPTSVYLIHNDDNQSNSTPGASAGDQSLPNPNGNDIALAQVNASTGALVRDHAIGSSQVGSSTNTNGMTVESAPVMGADAAGSRDIVFTASRTSGATQTRHLVVVRVDTAAAATDTSVTTVRISPAIPDLNLRARVALATLRDPSSGINVVMAVLPTTDGVKTVRLSDPGLADFGPSISGLGTTWSPSVPAQANAITPPVAPFLYVASASGDGTVVRKLAQGSGQGGEAALSKLVLAEGDGISPELPGKPGLALALAQTIPTAGAGAGAPQPGRVLVTTSANLYSLNTENLAASAPPQLFAAAPVAGFEHTAPATSGNLGFAVTDGGQQHVFFVTPVNGQMRLPVDNPGFQADENSLNANSSVGQPAISRGRVIFGSNNGAYAYGPSVAILQPAAGVLITDTVTLEAYVADGALANVTFRIDGVGVETDTLEANRASVTWNSETVLDGEHVVSASATDSVTTETSAPRRIVVDNWNDPTAALSVTPAAVATAGQTVTLDASGSSPTAGETGETIVRWAFEIDGDNDFDDIVEEAPGDGKVTTVFSTPGSVQPSVRVTDSHGDTAIATAAALRVNAPPTAALTATPAAVTSGGQVTFDAGGSADTDGSIVKYEFDLDGNGTFELDNGLTGQVTRTFTTSTTPGVRVTDNDGGTSVATAAVRVTPAPVTPPLEPGCTTAKRCAPGLTASVKPKRDRKLPVKFRVSGRLRLPAGVTTAQGCQGRVTVTVKRGRKRVARRIARVGATCRYSTTLTFRNRAKLGKAKRLRVGARFGGSALLLPKSAGGKSVRIR